VAKKGFVSGHRFSEADSDLWTSGFSRWGFVPLHRRHAAIQIPFPDCTIANALCAEILAAQCYAP
jgi:hypothetical protein